MATSPKTSAFWLCFTSLLFGLLAVAAANSLAVIWTMQQMPGGYQRSFSAEELEVFFQFRFGLISGALLPLVVFLSIKRSWRLVALFAITTLGVFLLRWQFPQFASSIAYIVILSLGIYEMRVRYRNQKSSQTGVPS